VDGAQPTSASDADRAQHFAGRIGRCEDIARAAMFLLSEDASFIDGAELVVDGGMTRRMIYHADEGLIFSA
jgi:NAD(P)-dependent dehydrogenase (short-subunit alcohol dehydrogenase family)